MSSPISAHSPRMAVRSNNKAPLHISEAPAAIIASDCRCPQRLGRTVRGRLLNLGASNIGLGSDTNLERPLLARTSD